jgi:hypothetical protein
MVQVAFYSKWFRGFNRVLTVLMGVKN